MEAGKVKRRIADIVVDTLLKNGIDICFSVVGGGAMHLNNAFVINDRVKKIYNHHEQACAMAAEAYARATGTMAAVCVTSGPGGLNTLNGVQGAWVDSLPMIVVSGFPRYETSAKSTQLDIRCRGVQENDIVKEVESFTKYSKLILDPLEIRREINYAVHLAMDGRRGPVWLDIPLNIQGMLVEETNLYADYEQNKEDSTKKVLDEIEKMNELLSKAKRPCILTGSGIRSGNAIEGFYSFVQKVQIPIVGGCIQPDICYEGQELYYGMSGNVGPRMGNFILQNADLIIVLGNSLSYKQTGFNQMLFAPKAKIIMVDAQRDEMRKPEINIELPITCELKMFFSLAEKYIKAVQAEEHWINYCDMLKQRFPKFEALVQNGRIEEKQRVPALFWWKQLIAKSRENDVFALGNSSCIYGILQEGIKYKTQRVLVNYNSGSMGHDLPNAIGCALGFKREIILSTGDGSIMMNLQELQTIKHYNLPVKVVVFSNNGYGAIRNTCRNFFNGTYTGCDESSGVSFPDFSKIAEAFGFPYYKCENAGQVDKCIEWMYEQKSYCFIEIMERIDEISGPKLVSRMGENGEFYTPALHDMYPFLDDADMAELMLE